VNFYSYTAGPFRLTAERYGKEWAVRTHGFPTEMLTTIPDDDQTTAWLERVSRALDKQAANWRPPAPKYDAITTAVSVVAVAPIYAFAWIAGSPFLLGFVFMMCLKGQC
jgi:hypothetical protein